MSLTTAPALSTNDCLTAPQVATPANPPKLIQGLELRVTYSHESYSYDSPRIAKEFAQYETKVFESIVAREIVRNPTKLNEKLTRQAHRHLASTLYGTCLTKFTLIESIALTNVEVIGAKSFTVDESHE